jgi:hypothetical protein
MNSPTLVRALIAALCFASTGLSQVPTDQLMKPPASARRFVVLIDLGIAWNVSPLEVFRWQCPVA